MYNMKEIINDRTSMIKFIAIFSMVLGATFLFGLYGPVEAEVSFWGFISICLGLLLLLLNLGNEFMLIKILITLTNIAIIAMQILPIYYWFYYSGYSISDNVPGSNFVAHWLFSLLHISLIILCFIYFVKSRKRYLENQ